jgi:hypothetical protein
MHPASGILRGGASCFSITRLIQIIQNLYGVPATGVIETKYEDKEVTRDFNPKRILTRFC